VCPNYWTNKDVSVSFDERCDVPEGVRSVIERLLNETWRAKATRDRQGAAMPRGGKVIDVRRIEDRNMWVSYHNKKASIRSQRGGVCRAVSELDGNPDRGHVLTKAGVIEAMSRTSDYCEALDTNLNEYYLWHGTSPEKADAIAKDGFRMELSGNNRGAMFGRGAYFAECASKADEYAEDGTGLYRGIFAALLCRVCCGEIYRVTAPDKTTTEEAVRSGRFDSVLGDREASAGTYREFVIYKQRQIYPEYAVLYRRFF